MGTAPSNTLPPPSPLPIPQDRDPNKNTTTGATKQEQLESPLAPLPHDSEESKRLAADVTSAKENAIQIAETNRQRVQTAETARLARIQAFEDTEKALAIVEKEQKVKEDNESASRLAALAAAEEKAAKHNAMLEAKRLKEQQFNLLVGKVVEMVVDDLFDAIEAQEAKRLAVMESKRLAEVRWHDYKRRLEVEAAEKERAKLVEEEEEARRAASTRRLAAIAELEARRAEKVKSLAAKEVKRHAEEEQRRVEAETAEKERVMAAERAAAEQAEVLRLKELEDDVVFQGGETLDERLARGAMSSIDLTLLEDTPVKSKPSSSGSSLPAIDLTQDTPVKKNDAFGPNSIIGKKINVRWIMSRGGIKIFQGTIDNYDQGTKLHHVTYDDGDTYSYEIIDPVLLQIAFLKHVLLRHVKSNNVLRLEIYNEPVIVPVPVPIPVPALTRGALMNINDGKHAGKTGTFIHSSDRTYRINIQGVGARNIAKKNASIRIL